MCVCVFFFVGGEWLGGGVVVFLVKCGSSRGGSVPCKMWVQQHGVFGRKSLLFGGSRNVVSTSPLPSNT